jgi:hypothetical protein
MQTNTARATAPKSERSSGQMLIAVFLRRLRSSDVVPEGAFDIFYLSASSGIYLIATRSLRRIARRPLRETRRYAFSAFTMGACLSSPPKTEPSNERSSEDEKKDFDLFD